MRIWGIFSTIAMGFLLGLVLAGVGGISAGIKASNVEKRIKSDRIEEYWASTQLKVSDLANLINSKSCLTSDKYFLSCVNGLITMLEKTSYRLTLSAEILPAVRKTVQFDNFNERENLVGFNQIFKEGLANSFNFENLIEKAIEINKAEPLQFSIGLGINGFLSVFKDPHTYVLPISYFNEVTSLSERSPYFVGISLDKRDGLVFIRKIFKNSDADLAGLKVGDRVLSVNGKSMAMNTLTEISMLLKSKEFRSFTFLIERDSSQYLKNLQRSYRVLNQVSDQILPDSTIGLIQVSKFSVDTCKLVKKSILNLSKSNLNGLVIDLRDNPGGRLAEASCMAGLFLGANKKIYSVKYFDPSFADEVVLSTGEKIYNGALAIIVNNNSASASELFAGSMQEHGRAIILGQRSFGKGTFQEIENWPSDSSIKLFKTKGFYLLSNGETTQLSGVSPDFYVNSGATEESSEQNNYFNPINPELYGLKSHKLDHVLPIAGCNVPDLTDTGIDPYLGAAKALLKCSQLVSEVANRFAENQSKSQTEQ